MAERWYHLKEQGLKIRVNGDFLTPREEFVVVEVSRGETALAIAQKLGLAENTIKDTSTKIAKKVEEAGYSWPSSLVSKIMTLIALGVFEIRADGTKVLGPILDQWKEEGDLANHSFL